MKLMASGVTFSAAMHRSPSFSRCSSSIMMIMWPRRVSSMASSTEMKGALALARGLISPNMEATLSKASVPILRNSGVPAKLGWRCYAAAYGGPQGGSDGGRTGYQARGPHRQYAQTDAAG